jgi:hypothetical protein
MGDSPPATATGDLMSVRKFKQHLSRVLHRVDRQARQAAVAAAAVGPADPLDISDLRPAPSSAYELAEQRIAAALARHPHAQNERLTRGEEGQGGELVGVILGKGYSYQRLDAKEKAAKEKAANRAAKRAARAAKRAAKRGKRGSKAASAPSSRAAGEAPLPGMVSAVTADGPPGAAAPATAAATTSAAPAPATITPAAAAAAAAVVAAPMARRPDPLWVRYERLKRAVLAITPAQAAMLPPDRRAKYERQMQRFRECARPPVACALRPQWRWAGCWPDGRRRRRRLSAEAEAEAEAAAAPSKHRAASGRGGGGGGAAAAGPNPAASGRPAASSSSAAPVPPAPEDSGATAAAAAAEVRARRLRRGGEHDTALDQTQTDIPLRVPAIAYGVHACPPC